MSTEEHLKVVFADGYDSGDILRRWPDRLRRHDEKLIGGSYRRFFKVAVEPRLHDSSVVMELGPGRGSWTRAILSRVRHGQVHVLDYLDVTKWLQPWRFGDRLVCHRVDNNSFSCLPDASFDFFFSFGVLCHHTSTAIAEIMRNALPKMQPGGVAMHQYADWQKLDRLGWDDRFGTAASSRDLPDDHEGNMWPRNDPHAMSAICRQAGWHVVRPDVGFFKRDSVVELVAPPVERALTHHLGSCC